jgi:hypothetical protein
VIGACLLYPPRKPDISAFSTHFSKGPKGPGAPWWGAKSDTLSDLFLSGRSLARTRFRGSSIRRNQFRQLGRQFRAGEALAQ